MTIGDRERQRYTVGCPKISIFSRIEPVFLYGMCIGHTLHRFSDCRRLKHKWSGTNCHEITENSDK